MATSTPPAVSAPRYITLTPLPLSSLPLSSPADLQKVLQDILNEASTFIGTVIPDDDPASATRENRQELSGTTTGGWKYLGPKKTPGWPTGHVNAFGKDIGGEKWVARRSLHPHLSQEQDDGAIEWTEFVEGLLKNHIENEVQYVESVKGFEKVWEWKERGNVGVGEIECAVYLVTHRLPPPLSQRIFPILLVTSRITDKSFLVVSLPVAGWENLESPAESRKMKGIIARYVAVERVRMLTNSPGWKEWITATASETGGVIPKFVERLTLPGAVVKDVGWFLGWVQGKRE